MSLLTASMVAMIATVAGAQIAGPPAASQNPSPMVEGTRAHERLSPTAIGGLVRSFAGPGGKAVEVWIPAAARSSNAVDLVVHFHGASWLPHQSAARLASPMAAAVVNLGAGSGGYHRAFADPASFDSLLGGIEREISAGVAKPVRVGRVTLSGFSAGHGAIRAILRGPRHFAKVNAVLLLDGMHTSYVPDGVVLDRGGGLDTTNLTAFADFARAAIRGEKRFVVTHSEIFPGTFASTTETAEWLLRALGVRRTAILKWGPRGMQQLSEVQSGGFQMLGFAGNSAPDHVDHFHGMPEFLARLLSAGSAEPGGTNGHDGLELHRGQAMRERTGRPPAILSMWLDAGLDLGNHSFSHRDINDTPLSQYQADVIRGEAVTGRLLRGRGKRLRYFRHPFLHAGKDLRTKRAFEKFLAGRGYSVAPVTIDNQEWVFAEVYAMAKERGDHPEQVVLSL